MKLLRSLAVAAAIAVVSAATPAGASVPVHRPTVVRTDSGLVGGTGQAGYRLFQGIPYAAPPVGALRWRPPQPSRHWRGVYDATRPRGQCAQIAPSYGGATTYGEDCLYLNVTAPDRPHGRSPVVVWVHGGSNETGNGADYDASKLATRGGVVVVTINYRLGVLGWLAHPGFETGADRHVQAGNYGLLDQQAALRWVRRNIAAFGGDPRNVTLAGESAGAEDTCANIASPAAAGLFGKAIPESYACTSPTRTEDTAEAQAVSLAEEVGCGDAATAAACLRALPVRTLLEAFQKAGVYPAPVSGGDRVLPRAPADAIASGRFNHVPVLHGSNLDEMRLFVGLTYPDPITAEQYAAIIRGTYGARADAVLARYPADLYPDPRLTLAAVQTDASGPLSTCTHHETYTALSHAGVPVYAYQFADRQAPPLIDMPGYDEGAEHATELTYLFPGLLGELNTGQERLSDAMVDYWTSFARTGRPAARQAPRWPRFGGEGDVLSLAPGSGGIHLTDTWAHSNCAFWTGE